MTQTPAFQVLQWYDAHQRSFPWRVRRGGVVNPYAVWLSEMMLQQTQTVTVVDYFNRFMAKWPRVEDLAAADNAAVMAEWAGLGYYARARNLHKAAQQIVAEHGGVFPQTEQELRGLAGVGPYTAAAIAAIAFDVPAVVVDGNIERVVSRFHVIETPLPTSKPEIYRFATAMTPQTRAGDYAQALMDIGATICTPTRPACGVCPLQDGCKGLRLGIAESLPRKLAKPVRPVRYGVAYWLENDRGEVMLVKRAEKGLLGGMMAFPGSEWHGAWPEKGDGAPVGGVVWQRQKKQIRHIFTHFTLYLAVDCGKMVEDTVVETGVWWPVARLTEAGLPKLMQKVVTCVQE